MQKKTPSYSFWDFSQKYLLSLNKFIDKSVSQESKSETLLLTERIIINHRTCDIPHITANETGFHKFRSEVSDYLPELITRFCAELPLAIIYPLYYNVH